MRFKASCSWSRTGNRESSCFRAPLPRSTAVPKSPPRSPASWKRLRGRRDNATEVSSLRGTDVDLLLRRPELDAAVTKCLVNPPPQLPADEPLLQRRGFDPHFQAD